MQRDGIALAPTDHAKESPVYERDPIEWERARMRESTGFARSALT